MVEAGAVRDQQRGQFQTVLVGGDVERRAVLAGAGVVDAGAVTQQHVDRRRAAVQRRQVQRRTLLHTHTAVRGPRGTHPGDQPMSPSVYLS